MSEYLMMNELRSDNAFQVIPDTPEQYDSSVHAAESQNREWDSSIATYSSVENEEVDGMRCYTNKWLDCLKDIEKEFFKEAVNPQHRLMDLVKKWQQSINQLDKVMEEVKLERDVAIQRSQEVYKVETQINVQNDAFITLDSYSYTTQCYDTASAQQLKESLQRIRESLLEKSIRYHYESEINKVEIDVLLDRVKSTSLTTGLSEVRQCIAVILHFLRRSQSGTSGRTVLIDWVVYLGLIIATNGDINDRLYLLWQLLRAPVGVGRWGASLVQIPPDCIDAGLVYLSMIVNPLNNREVLFAHLEDNYAWTSTDSNDDEDNNSLNNSYLLEESDLISLLNQLPVKAMFDYIYTASNSDSQDDCHNNAMLRLIAFCHRLIQILDHALEVNDHPGYKTFNEMISDLISFTVEFVTNKLDCLDESNKSVTHRICYKNNCRQSILTQYEAFFDAVLHIILSYPSHDNWRPLADLPWRIIPAQHKLLLLSHLLAPHSTFPIKGIEEMVLCLRDTLGSVEHINVVYLLTAISNLATECNPSIQAEYELMSLILSLLFRTCYVNTYTRLTLADLGRDLLSRMSIRNPDVLSCILNLVEVWNPFLDDTVISLFRELPFNVMIPTDNQFNLLYSWLLDSTPSSTCSQLARHILTYLNWGFTDCDETCLYLPLSLHQKTANLIVLAFTKHVTAKSQRNILDSIKLVTFLRWNQMNPEDQPFHSWCLSLVTRLRLHSSIRSMVSDQRSLQSSTIICTSFNQPDTNANCVSIFVTIVTLFDIDLCSEIVLKLLQKLIDHHHQYRLALEVINNGLLTSTSAELDCLLDCDAFMTVWRNLVHKDTFYNTANNVITQDDIGSVLLCIGNSFCPSLIIAGGNTARQRLMMTFFLRTVFNVTDWFHDQRYLWLLDKLLEINTALDLQVGTNEVNTAVKSFTDRQISKKSGLSLFQTRFETLLSLIKCQQYLWLVSYILGAQTKIEDDLLIWPTFQDKVLVAHHQGKFSMKKIMHAVCQHLTLSLKFGYESLSIIEAAQILASCLPGHVAVIKIADVFFSRYLSWVQTWNHPLTTLGRLGHIIFQDKECHSILLRTISGITAAHQQILADLKSLKEAQENDIDRLAQLEFLIEHLSVYLLWIDDPQIRQPDIIINELTPEYRSELLERYCLGLAPSNHHPESKLIIGPIQQGARLWTCRHDQDATQGYNSPTSQVPIKRLHQQARVMSTSILPSDLYRGQTLPNDAVLRRFDLLKYVVKPIRDVNQCAVKFHNGRHSLATHDEEYLKYLPPCFTSRTVTENRLKNCHGGELCSQPSSDDLTNQTWIVNEFVAKEITRNREAYNKQLDEMLRFDQLEDLVIAVMSLHYLIEYLGSQLSLYHNNDETQKVADFGMFLFFHIGRKSNTETHGFTTHRRIVASCLASLNSIFEQYISQIAYKVLKYMSKTDHLIQLYEPYFNPNIDDPLLPKMYSFIIHSYQKSRYSSDQVYKLLRKFDMNALLKRASGHTSVRKMLSTLCFVIGTTKSGETNEINKIHMENLVILLSNRFSQFLPMVHKRFLTLVEEQKLEPEFWRLLLKCGHQNTKEHGALSLTIDEIKTECTLFGSWLLNARFTDPECKDWGLFSKYGPHAATMAQHYGVLIDSLQFKQCRSAQEDLVSLQEVISVVWNHLLNVYTPWLQAFPDSETGICYPWRIQDRDIAESLIHLFVEQINLLAINLSSLEAIISGTNDQWPALLLENAVVWIINDLLVHQQLPNDPYHVSYCSIMNRIRWDILRPSMKCIKVILEFLSRANNSDQSVKLIIDICSQVPWSKISYSNDTSFKGVLFELVVTMVCKISSVFEGEPMKVLLDEWCAVDWNQLTSEEYRRGMERISDYLGTDIIMSDPLSMEGKVIRLLCNMAGHCGNTANDFVTVADKHAYYIATNVRLLSTAFSSHHSASLLRVLEARIFDLLTEIEAAIILVQDPVTRQKCAITMLFEVIVLFKVDVLDVIAINSAIRWIQKSKSSVLILPLLNAVYKWPPNIVIMVRFANELIEAYLVSGSSMTDQSAFTTICECAHLSPEIEEQYLAESVRHNCVLCLAQQISIAVPFVTKITSEKWQNRVVCWLEEIILHESVPEQGVILLIYFYLRLFLPYSRTNHRPAPSFEPMISVLMKLSCGESISFELQVLCKSIMVFMQGQLPTNNLLRIMPRQPGGLLNPNMIISSRLPGQPLPTGRTFQNLHWLKNQRQRQDLSMSTKEALVSSIRYICDDSHCIMDCITFLRLLCNQIWPDAPLLRII